MALIEHYRRSVEAAGLEEDPGQLAVIDHLQRLTDELADAGSFQTRSVIRRLFRSEESYIRGLYLWGGVGRGKTHLMDLFFSEVPINRKIRIHFHRFMQSVHRELKDLRHTEDPLSKIGRNFSKRCKVLCLDEFFVLDIGDAVILSGLLEALIENGVVIVVTSNTRPDALYLGGIQRDRFMAAIRLINQRMDVVEIGAGTDYRLQAMSGQKLYYDALADNTDAALQDLFDGWSTDLSSDRGAVEILARSIQTVRYAETLVWFEFSDICDGPRSKADYIEIANLYRTVIISNVPVLNWELENQARRFIELVDEFYDRAVHLVLSAEGPINSLYTGKRLIREFERTASRLHEMQTDRYLSRAHGKATEAQ